MTDKLKPCPFCGSDTAPRLDAAQMSLVWCDTTKDGCGARGRPCWSPAEAVAAWNRRAPAPQSAPPAGTKRVRVQLEATEYGEVCVNEKSSRQLAPGWRITGECDIDVPLAPPPVPVVKAVAVAKEAPNARE